MLGKFDKRKQDVLSKSDKSSKGDWDKEIAELCDKINSSGSYYTTSSCSGRILLIKAQDKKAPNLFEFVSHEVVGFEKFVKVLEKLKTKSELKFKQEPVILHVACRSLKHASEILEKARKAGWKRSGIISPEKNIVELLSTEKLEFPIIKKKILVDDDFLKLVLKTANENLKKGWEKIEKLQKELCNEL